jgi:transposase
MNIKLLAIDIAKNVFQLHGNDQYGKCVYKKRITRNKLSETITNLPVCTIVMESCAGSNHWHRKFVEMGHSVKLIAPQYVKPYVKTNKNDANDAEAIAEAASRPSMRYVKAKTIEQQDIQFTHKIRSRLIKNRTQLLNQIKGLLLEYGIAVSQTYYHIAEFIPSAIEDTENELSESTRDLLNDLYEEFNALNDKVKQYDLKIKVLVKNNNHCARLMEVKGIGQLSASAIVSTLSDPNHFKNGRHFAAYLGLAPKQHSSGNKSCLLGISKRGNIYLRTLLIHGARAVISNAKDKTDPYSKWIQEKLIRSGYCKTAIAIANKNAKVAWSLLANNSRYDSSYKAAA